MAHGRDKPGKEKRKPKKGKSSASKAAPGSEIISHISHGTNPAERE